MAFTVTMDEKFDARLTKAASRMGVSKAAFLRMAAAEKMQAEGLA